MTKRKLRNNGRRPKAFLGLAASVATPMLVNAGASLLSSIIGAGSNYLSQKSEADAIADASRENADALAEQNRINTENQQKMIDFQKGEYAKMRNDMMRYQLNGQLQAGVLNNAARQEAARFKLKYGGKKKLNNAAYFLQGIYSQTPVTTTDGGVLIPYYVDNQGYGIYDAVGATHKEEHNGKTGIGIKTPDGKEIEVENKEKILVQPDRLFVYSAHNIPDKQKRISINPSEAIENGADPNLVADIQEDIKERNGLSNDGSNKTPVRRLRYAGRRKAALGDDMNGWGLAPRNYFSRTYGIPSTTGINYTPTNLLFQNENNGLSDSNYFNLGDIEKTMNNGFWWNTGANVLGAAVTGLDNYLGYRNMRRALRDAYNYSESRINQMHGINPSVLSSEDFSTGHAMAAIQAPRVYTGAERSAAERVLHRSLRNINNGTLSSAAAQQRRAIAGSDYIDRINQIQSDANKLQQGIVSDNMNRITDVSKTNAQLDAQSRRDYASNMLNLLQYNNDIENDKYSMLADNYNRYRLGTAGVYSDMRRTNNSIYGNTLGMIGNNYANTANTINNWRYGLGVASLGANPETWKLVNRRLFG